MLDVSFSELLVIAVVALVVIGPKRLPETIRFAGLWFGRIKRGLSRAYQEMDRELGLDDIRRQLHNEDVLRSIEDHKRKVEAEIRASLDGAVEPAAGSTEAADDTPSLPSADVKEEKEDKADG